MEIWHVGAPATSVIRKFLQLGLKNHMASAWTHYRTNSRFTEMKAATIRAVGGRIFIDSGMISALRKDPSWEEHQEDISALGRRVRADYVSHLDVPMERTGLRIAKLTRRRALEITIRNARVFLDSDVGDAKKVFVIQGYSIDEYAKCLDAFEDLGIPDGGALGIGTCCMRPVTRGLWQILEFVRDRTEGQWLHAFGVGDVEKLDRLQATGVDSVDEGNTVRAFAYRNQHQLERLLKAYRRFDA